MKKLAVLSIALLMLTTLVFAEVKVEPAVSFSGSGTLTWGIDLVTMNNGFSNSASSNLTVTLVASSSETKGGAEGETVFGAISLTGMKVVLNSGATTTVTNTDGDDVAVAKGFVTAPTVDAYVMLGPAKWFIYAAPDLAITYAGAIEDDANDAAWWAEGDETDGVAPDFGAGATGVEIAAGPATIDVFIASSADWTAAGNYGVGAKVGLTAGPAAINAGVNYGPLAAGGVLGAGASLALTAGPATIKAGFDLATPTTAWEVSGGVSLALTDVADITANVAYSAGWSLDTEVGVTLSAVPNLDLSALIGLWNITTGLAWGVDVSTGYKIMMGETNYVKPAVEAWISTPNGGVLTVALSGTVTAVLIPNTTFVLTFTDHYLTGGTGDPVLTFATTVAY